MKLARVYFHKTRPNNACTYGGGNKDKLKKCGNLGNSNWNSYKVCGEHWIKLEKRVRIR